MKIKRKNLIEKIKAFGAVGRGCGGFRKELPKRTFASLYSGWIILGDATQPNITKGRDTNKHRQL